MPPAEKETHHSLNRVDPSIGCVPPSATVNTVPNVPFFRLELQECEVQSVADVLRSGWLTTGAVVKQFEDEFVVNVRARFGLAVNSCTAALHLAVAALDLKPNQAVLVPTHTFAATAEVVRYLGATPILVDVEPTTLNLDLNDAQRKIHDLRQGRLPETISASAELVGMIPVHVGGHMLDMESVRSFAREHGLWVVEDAAHAFPAAYRRNAAEPWRRCGEDTSDVTCFSFYANKPITTGEGGMAVTASQALADRMKVLSLHGLSRDAFVKHLKARGVAFSVHWRPLHLHTYYQETYRWQPAMLPVASREWTRLISLPLFPTMRDDEVSHVVQVVTSLCREYAR